jgi:hypothetical protein
MSQPSLFDPAPGQWHLFGSDTEAEAALSVTAVTGRLRKRALELLRYHDATGLTDDEGGALMGGDRLTFGRRRNELAKAGLVYDSGDRRRTPTGRKATVWKAKPDDA